MKKYLLTIVTISLILVISCKGFKNYTILNEGKNSSTYSISDANNKVFFEFYGEYSWVSKKTIHTVIAIKVTNKNDQSIRLDEKSLVFKSKYFDYNNTYKETKYLDPGFSDYLIFEMYGKSNGMDRELDLYIPSDDTLILKLDWLSIEGVKLNIPDVKFRAQSEDIK